MKQFVCLLLFCITGLTATAQTSDPKLNSRMAAFMQLSKKLDLDKLMDFMYPRIYELAPKATIVKEMKKAFNSADMQITSDSLAILSADNITTAGTTSFTRFKYFSSFNLHIAQKDSAEDMADAYLMAYRAQFGKDNVDYDGQTNTFHIKAVKYVIAIKDRYSKNEWVFVSQEQNALLRKLLPTAVVKKYKL
jgi:hypothetical protein